MKNAKLIVINTVLILTGIEQNQSQAQSNESFFTAKTVAECTNKWHSTFQIKLKHQKAKQ